MLLGHMCKVKVLSKPPCCLGSAGIATNALDCICSVRPTPVIMDAWKGTYTQRTAWYSYSTWMDATSSHVKMQAFDLASRDMFLDPMLMVACFSHRWLIESSSKPASCCCHLVSRVPLHPLRLMFTHLVPPQPVKVCDCQPKLACCDFNLSKTCSRLPL